MLLRGLIIGPLGGAAKNSFSRKCKREAPYPANWIRRKAI